MIEERPFAIESDGLKLEGALHDGAGPLAAVVLHPHPQYGGDMDNFVVMSLCSALAALGATTLRFNFRGAGRSEGSYDAGRGEASDAGAAVDALREAHPHERLLLVGYSFGAMVAANAAADVKPDAMVLVSPPTSVNGLPPLDPSLPALLATGANDRVSPAASLRAMEAPNHRVVIVPEADHGWWPGVDELVAAVTQFVTSSLIGNC